MDNPARPDSVLTAARFPGDRAMDNRKRLPTPCQQVARCPQAPQAATTIFYSFPRQKAEDRRVRPVSRKWCLLWWQTWLSCRLLVAKTL